MRTMKVQNLRGFGFINFWWKVGVEGSETARYWTWCFNFTTSKLQ